MVSLHLFHTWKPHFDIPAQLAFSLLFLVNFSYAFLHVSKFKVIVKVVCFRVHYFS